MAKLGRVLALALLAGCSSGASVEAPAELPEAKLGRVAILLYGFFDNADPAAFAPEPIAYPDVDLDAVHERLSRRIGRYGYRSPVRVLSQAEASAEVQRSTVSRSETQARMLAALRVLDAMANEQPTRQDLVRALRSPVAFPGWDVSDSVLLVLALDTRLRDGSADGLRSLVGCFWFSGAGESIVFAPAPYDARGLDTQELVRLVGERCPLPQGPRGPLVN